MAATRAAQTELVIITGLSGSGKGTVLKALEDLGYYSVDNLPIDLIPKFAQLTKDAPNIRRAALVVDIREGKALDRFPKLFKQISKQVPTRLVFLEADDASLIRRFSETRRPHPLGTGQSVAQSIRSERERLEPIRKLAEPIINTTKFNVHELRDLIHNTFGSQQTKPDVLVQVNSFGYRHGVPADSDLVFDVRFLPNPNYIPAFKNYSGKQPAVARYIRSFPQTQEFIDRISDLLVYLIPHYIREGKSYLTISFGCTGGHHRSVLIASEICKRLQVAGYRTKETHRDLKKN
ncbi:MAG: RNase adapter RapZ [Bryobacteraceae bacterium]